MSAARKDGVIFNVKIISEQGKHCTLINPWPGQSVTLKRDGVVSETLSGERLSFPTRPDEVIEIFATTPKLSE